MEQLIVESSVPLTVDVIVEEEQVEPEPHVDAAVGSPTDDGTKSKKKKKKKKKNRRKSVEGEGEDPQRANSEREDEEGTNWEEACIEETLVTLKSDVVDETLITDTRLEIEETTVKTTLVGNTAGKSPVAEASFENKRMEDSTQQHGAATPNDLASLNLERTSSLDALKATGTKAVGSLFSRFKVGLKKPLPSYTESPVKAAGKEVGGPEVKGLDTSSVRTPTAHQAASSYVSSSAEMQALLEPAKERAEAESSVKVEEKYLIETAQGVSTVVRDHSNIGADLSIPADPVKLDKGATTRRTVTTSVSTIKRTSFKHERDNVQHQEVLKDTENDDHGVVVPTHELASKAITSSSTEAISATESAKDEAVLTTNSTNIEAVISKKSVESEVIPSLQIATHEAVPSIGGAQNEAVSSTENAENEAILSAASSEIEVSTSTESAEDEAVLATERGEVEVVSSTESAGNEVLLSTKSAGNEAILLIEKDENEAVPSNESAQNKAVLSTKSAQNETISLSESTQKAAALLIDDAQDEAVLITSRESLSIAVAPSTERLSAEAASIIKPEKLSPVKSLASRFEGKREQSLDSLKFRTVREFFPTERSIRVGAEKKKFEAQAQQQHLKAKAEQEAKAKYNSGSKAFDEISESGSVTGTVLPSSALKTPDAASIRKTWSFDEVSVSSQSSSKFSDEAITPVKSIASRFEGKREQSLDSLKFRTVREFFPDEEKRSVHVGAEKAKYEALQKQQEEAAKSAQSKVKHMTSVTEKKSAAESMPSGDAVSEMSSSTLDESQDETTSSGLSESGVKKEEDVKLIGKIVATEVVVDESVTAVNVIEAVVVAEDGEAGSLTAQADKVAECSEEILEEKAIVNHVDVDGGVNLEVVDSLRMRENEENKENIDQLRNNGDGDIDRKLVCDDYLSAEVEQIFKEDGTMFNDVTVVESVASQLIVSCDNEANATRDLFEVDEKVVTGELIQVDLHNPVILKHPVESLVIAANDPVSSTIEVNDQDNQQIKEIQEAVKTEIELSVQSAGDGLVERDQLESIAEPPTTSHGEVTSGRPMLTTERSFVMDKDDTIKTEDTVVVGERPMTDGEDEFEPVSPALIRPAHELHAGITSFKSKKHEQVKNPAVSVPKKRVSSYSPAASTTAKKAAAPQNKKSSASKLKSTVSTTKQNQSGTKQTSAKSGPKQSAPAAPTAASSSSQTRNTVETAKPKVSTSGIKKIPTAPIAQKCASNMAPAASLRAKKAAELAKELPTASPVRSKRYASVKSKVLEGIQSGINQLISHKKITKEEFIAAERRKSLGSANVRSVFETVDRRASLCSRASITGPPEQFVRSAISRKKLNLTVPRYMNYENTRGYTERARVQYERRKRLEEANAAKSEKRQQELQVFFKEQQHKSLLASADEVRRGLEAHEFNQLVKENELQAKKMLRRDKQRSTQPFRRTSSASSSAGASSNGLTCRTSKRSSVSSASVEGKTVALEIVKTAVQQEVVMDTTQIEAEMISFSLGDGNSILEEHMADSDLNETRSDRNEEIVASE